MLSIFFLSSLLKAQNPRYEKLPVIVFAPKYNGGEKALTRFIASVLDHPDLRESESSNRIYSVYFKINADSTLSDVSAESGVSLQRCRYNEKLTDLFKKMSWIPCIRKENGKDEGTVITMTIHKTGKKIKYEYEYDLDVSSWNIRPGDYRFNKQKGTRKCTSETRPFKAVEQQPYFSTDENALSEFMENNLKNPTNASGRVIVEFIVCEDGSIYNIKVVRGLTAECDKEAVRLIESMPEWIPGKQNGKPVPVIYTLPIKFD